MSTESTTLTLIPVELANAIDSTALATEGKQTLRDCFAPHFIAFHELAESAKEIAVNAPKAAREKRLELKAVRVACEKTRKALKDDILVRGRAIDSINAMLEVRAVAIEERLEKIEKAEEIAAAERKAALKAEREALLKPYGLNTNFYDLAGMDEAAFSELLSNTKLAQEARAAQEAKAEADRIAREQAEAAERERVRLENERLRKEAAEREEEARKERLRQQAILETERARAQAEREAAEKVAAAERAEIQRKADEAAAVARKEREAAEQKANEERAAREKAEAELAAKKAADAKREADERRAAKKAAAAPDKEKLTVFIQNLVREVPMPTMTTEDGCKLADEITARRDSLVAWATQQIATL